MLGRLTKDWPVFLMPAGIMCFIIYAFINSKREEIKIKESLKRK